MKNLRLALYGFLLVVLASCSSAKALTYFKDMEVGIDYDAIPKPETILRPGDIVNITVSASEPQLAAPFNITTAANLQALIVQETEDVGQNRTNVKGYLLDEQGNIDFPVLGSQNLAGLTLSQVKEMITKQIINGGYIKEPLVTVDIKNFKYTVIGEAGKGNYTVNGNSINLIQAIAAAGGINDNYAKLKDIRVIRTVDGKRKAYSVNLLKKEVFDSPVFYLQQDDIIYVKHRGARLNPNTNFGLTLMGTIGSVGSFATMIVYYMSIARKNL